MNAVYEGLPVASAAQMRALDERAERDYGLPVLVLMETAGKAVAGAASALMDRRGPPAAQRRVVIVCGRGNNGGDGLVAARHLKGKAADVSVFIAAAEDGAYGEAVSENLRRLRALGADVQTVDGDTAELDAALERADWVLDALLGTGSSGAPRGTVLAMTESTLRSKKPVIAVDLPSGLDADTGEAAGACVRAAATLTLALAKRGLLEPRAREYVGTLQVLDIGFPAGLIKEVFAP